MSVRLLDPLLAAPETTQALQLHRYRSEYVARELWRVYQGRAHWSVMVRGRSDGGGGGAKVAGGGSLDSLKAAYMEVVVPAAARLGIEDHLVRVWRSALRSAYRTLTVDEEHAFEDYLSRPRHAAIFRVEGASVRRNHGASSELARAALKLMSAAEARKDDR